MRVRPFGEAEQRFRFCTAHGTRAARRLYSTGQQYRKHPQPHTQEESTSTPAHIYCSLPSSRKAAPKPLAACVCMEAPRRRAAEGRSGRSPAGGTQRASCGRAARWVLGR